MKFWTLEEPGYESDYQQVYINGSIEHPFGLPGVRCDVCGQTWGGSRILPYECPRDLQRNKSLTDRWAIPLMEHKALQHEVLMKLKVMGAPVSELRPGDDFQPCYLDVPSRPMADFLWPSLESLVVSQRVKNILMEHCPRDISCCEVILRKVGKREPMSTAPIPESGEPGDIIGQVELTSSSNELLGPYYEVCIANESGLPPGCENLSICSGCGRVELDDSKREIRMIESMWRGDQIFFLATTLYIVITDSLKQAIESLAPTNVVFSQVRNCSKAMQV
jgi:hypothetical protein